MIKQSVDNVMPKRNALGGIYRGVIEDNNDPDMLGRCRIRVWGVHDELKDEGKLEGIPTKNLPWAEPCLGLIEGSVSGAGLFSVPLQGSHVFLFFEGANWQSPRYFATAPGLPTEAPDTSKGFNDPSGTYPREDRLNQPDYHKLSRGDTVGTLVEHKNDNVDTDVPIANSGETWTEPDSAYAAEYPENIVLATHGGVTVEIDSTAGKQRVHIWHPSNSYIEIDFEGNVVFRNEGDRFEIIRADRNKHVLGSDNETVDIDKTIKVGADQNVEIGSNVKREIGGTLNEHVEGTWTFRVDGAINIESGSSITLKAPRIDLNP
jgi:hypothetical protein